MVVAIGLAKLDNSLSCSLKRKWFELYNCVMSYHGGSSRRATTMIDTNPSSFGDKEARTRVCGETMDK